MSARRAILSLLIHSTRNTRRILRRQPLLKTIFVLTFALLFEAGLTALFYDGLQYLDSFEGLGAVVIGRLFSLFFLGMGLMLAVSSILTAYSTLFRCEEIPFLLTCPLRTSEIFVYKFLEATGLSSWSFFFIVIPFVSAYAWFQRAGAWFGVWTLVFSLPFLLLCSGIGTGIALALVRWVPRGRPGRWLGITLLVAFAGGVLWMARRTLRSFDDTPFNLRHIVPGLRLASNPWVPSSWMAEGITAMARGEWTRGLRFWSALASSAWVVGLAIEALGRRTFAISYQRVLAGSSRQRRSRSAVGRRITAGLRLVGRLLPRDIRAIVIKDLRTFLRDPVQWSQGIMFFGLLGLYFANLRTFRYHEQMEHWRNMMGFLNIFSVAAVMCSISARFIYPQLSLEGQSFWIIGLSPTTMTRVLLSKFALSASVMVVIGAGLVELSAVMLNVSHDVRLVSLLLVSAISLGVSGLSTGLGAVFLDLRQSNPAAIVSGFGGTLNLVASLAFMLAVILPFAMLFHMQTILRLNPTQLRTAGIAAVLWLTAVTLGATLIPLWLGARSLRCRDY